MDAQETKNTFNAKVYLVIFLHSCFKRFGKEKTNDAFKKI